MALAIGAALLMYFLILRRRKGWTVEDLFSRLDVFDGFLIAWAFSFLLFTIKFGLVAGLMNTGLSYFTLFWSGITLFLFKRNIKTSKETMLLLTFSVFFIALFSFDEAWIILYDKINRIPLSLEHLVINHLRNLGIIIVNVMISLKLGSGKWKIHFTSFIFAVLFSGSMFILWVLGGFLDFRYSDDIVSFVYWFASIRLGTNLILYSIRISDDVKKL